MPDLTATLLGIAVLALATYLTRVAGYFVGDRVRQDSTVSRVLETLPGAALSGVLALSLAQAAPADLLAVVATVGVFLLLGRTLPAIGAGLLVAVVNAHWFG